MSKRSQNKNLSQAKKNKKDEFYTQLSDIERELKHYKKHFKGKVVYCNCDDPRVSNFFHYFSYNFEKLGLKKLITTCYKNKDMNLFSQSDSEEAIYLEYTGDKNGNNVPDIEEIGIKSLKGDGDFRSEESIELLKEADIVVTNPPFSLFREYVTQLIEYDKKFIIIGNQNAITYKEIYDYVLEKNYELKYTKLNSDIFARTQIKVDTVMGELLPNTIKKITSAYENLLSENNEDWSNAVHSCRRILQDLADEIYPATEDKKLVNGKTIKLGVENYINRLIAYIDEHSSSKRFEEIVGSNLKYIGERLDSIFNAVQKGSHKIISTQDEADRYVIYTYLLVGDILKLKMGIEKQIEQ